MGKNMGLAVAVLWSVFTMPAQLVAQDVDVHTSIAKNRPKPLELNAVYSSIRTIEETGDILGMQVEFQTKNGKTTALVITCEGQCDKGKRWPVVVSDHTLQFRVKDDDGVDSNGTPFSLPPIRYVGRFSKNDLIITSPNIKDWSERLKKGKKEVVIGG